MNQKDLIKWGVVAALVYFGWRYLQDHGGFNALLGSGVPAGTGAHPAVSTVPPAGTTTQPVNTTQQVPVLDFNGLVVARDVNDSLTGTVKINGVPVRLSIITADGRIFDSTGSEVTAALQGQGVDVAALRGAFQNAGSSLAGLGTVGGRVTPSWFM